MTMSPIELSWTAKNNNNNDNNNDDDNDDDNGNINRKNVSPWPAVFPGIPGEPDITHD